MFFGVCFVQRRGHLHKLAYAFKMFSLRPLAVFFHSTFEGTWDLGKTLVSHVRAKEKYFHSPERRRIRRDTNYKAGRVRALARRWFNAITLYTNRSIRLQE